MMAFFDDDMMMGELEGEGETTPDEILVVSRDKQERRAGNVTRQNRRCQLPCLHYLACKVSPPLNYPA